LLLHHNNASSHASFFTIEFLSKNNMAVVPHPFNFSVSPIQDKTETDPTEMIETELQVVLNTLTEHDLQDAF
jgi:hypothetical protein